MVWYFCFEFDSSVIVVTAKNLGLGHMFDSAVIFLEWESLKMYKGIAYGSLKGLTMGSGIQIRDFVTTSKET